MTAERKDCLELRVLNETTMERKPCGQAGPASDSVTSPRLSTGSTQARAPLTLRARPGPG